MFEDITGLTLPDSTLHDLLNKFAQTKERGLHVTELEALCIYAYVEELKTECDRLEEYVTRRVKRLNMMIGEDQ